MNTEKPVILVVDDEEKNRKLMDAMLHPMGYTIIFANDGEEAVQKAISEQPDVILLDILMPKKNGFEVVKELKQNNSTKYIPLVMVTAMKNVGQRAAAYDIGVDDFLSKPIDQVEIRSRVRSLLKVKQLNDMQQDYQKVLEQHLAEKTKNLKKAISLIRIAQRETIHRLSTAAEYKDEDTGSHLKRMMNYAATVSRAMGLDDKKAEQMLLASPMHDIGKIGIPDEILLKPGRLNPDERRIMQTHAEIGAQILTGSYDPVIKTAEIIALTHHEKWDGSGYPKGLKKEDIPIEGRIAAVADVFDALTSKRPYKNAFPVDKSLQIIRGNSGTHFDPQVVDAFFSIQAGILDIKEKYNESGISKFLEIQQVF